jgi:hypothetical protein
MADPWDIPPLPKRGDLSAQITWAAVGKALTEWEELELYLARVYAVFIGLTPFNAIQEATYKDAAIFRERANVIERAAESYFAKHPCQDIEGDFEALMREARNLAQRRNDIAHGVVKLVWMSEFADIVDTDDLRQEYLLAPAAYRAKQFDWVRTPTYLYSSIEILRFAEAFRDCRFDRVERFLILVMRDKL